MGCRGTHRTAMGATTAPHLSPWRGCVEGAVEGVCQGAGHELSDDDVGLLFRAGTQELQQRVCVTVSHSTERHAEGRVAESLFLKTIQGALSGMRGPGKPCLVLRQRLAMGCLLPFAPLLDLCSTFQLKLHPCTIHSNAVHERDALGPTVTTPSTPVWCLGGGFCGGWRSQCGSRPVQSRRTVSAAWPPQMSHATWPCTRRQTRRCLRRRAHSWG